MGIVEDAVAAIRAGRPVVLPTDTVYGLCASPDRPEPVARLCRLKGRPGAVATSLLCADIEVLFDLVPELRGRSEPIVRALLPGRYTLVLPNPAGRYPWLSSLAQGTIGVRVPVLEGAALEIVLSAGAVAATSANRHRGPDPGRLGDVPEEIRAACGALVDGGGLPGIPSTVLDLTGAVPRIIREGAGDPAAALARLAAIAG